MCKIGYLNESIKQDIITFGLQLLSSHLEEGCSDELIQKMVDCLHNLFCEIYGFNEENSLLTWVDEMTIWKSILSKANSNINNLPLDIFAQTVASQGNKAMAITHNLRKFNEQLDVIHTSSDARASSMLFLLESRLYEMGVL